jgi:hypothetical protein
MIRIDGPTLVGVEIRELSAEGDIRQYIPNDLCAQFNEQNLSGDDNRSCPAGGRDNLERNS